MGERSRELFLLLLGDILVFAAALWLTLAVRYLEVPTEARLSLHLGPFSLLAALWLFLFYVAGLYDKHTVFLKTLLFNRILNTQVVNVLVAALLFLILPFEIAPKTNLLLYLIISVALLSWWRLVLFNRLSPKAAHKAVLIAGGEEAKELAAEVNQNDRYNYSFVHVFDDAAVARATFTDDLLALIRDEGVRIIVTNPRGQRVEEILPTLYNLAFLEYRVTFLDFYKVFEDTFDRVPLSAIRYDWFITHVSQSRNALYDFLKRAIDIAGSVVIGFLFLVALPMIYAAVRMEGRIPQLFMWQRRIGQYNTPMYVLKLQTMTKNDIASGTWMSEDATRGNVVTPVGHFIRKLSLDEVPQVYNVLKGEMSLIGPRNDIEGLGHRLAEAIPYYNIRNFVKPGITGWAQTHQYYTGNNISPQSLEESKLRLAYDLYYVKNRSLLLDIEIALRTIKTLLARIGG